MEPFMIAVIAALVAILSGLIGTFTSVKLLKQRNQAETHIASLLAKKYERDDARYAFSTIIERTNAGDDGPEMEVFLARLSEAVKELDSREQAMVHHAVSQPSSEGRSRYLRKLIREVEEVAKKHNKAFNSAAGKTGAG